MKQFLILGIFIMLTKNKKTTAKEIAEKFEVSTRTVYRYVDAICMSGLPVSTTLGKNGGISIDKNFKLDNSFSQCIEESDNPFSEVKKDGTHLLKQKV
ncbi:MAG: HTH domain-containing protein [Clostridia bacterium]